MIREIHILEPLTEVKHCIIALAGRGNSVDEMLQISKSLEFPDTLIVSIRPQNFAWYPAPKNPNNQSEAVRGLHFAIASIKDKIFKIHTMYNLKEENTTLLGFSAGAVVGLQVALNSFGKPYHSMIGLSGAILEPLKIPLAMNQSTQYVLQHNKDDDCFDWHERYMPMKKSLLNCGYNLAVVENNYGNHKVILEDMVAISNFLSKSIGKQSLHSQTQELTPSSLTFPKKGSV